MRLGHIAPHAHIAIAAERPTRSSQQGGHRIVSALNGVMETDGHVSVISCRQHTDAAWAGKSRECIAKE